MMAPHSEEELIEAVASAPVVRTGDVLKYFSIQPLRPTMTLSYYMGIVDFSPSDQVVTVRTGTQLDDLQKVLAREGQCIPHKFPLKLNVGTTQVGNLIDFNLPHALEASCGTWRDWVLAMRIVLPDGTLCNAGSHAVKNVAGYDVQKLLIGARGTLGIISQVTLRTFPLGALPVRSTIDGGTVGNHPIYIHRTLLGRIDALAGEAGSRTIAVDPLTGTLWAGLAANEALEWWPGDWVVRSGCGEKNLQVTDPTQIRFMKRAKDIFDPTYKLNPGEMGIF